jgi:hypothetical protein
MLLFIISAYLMIIQYLHLVPEYIQERIQQHRDYVLHNTNSRYSLSACLSLCAYAIAALLTEVPRSIIQSCVCLSIVYLMHPLNPATVNALFTYVTCMVGVCAWQSMICLCCALTDMMGSANTFCFLVLGR